MSEENKGYDFTGLSADEDFDSFLESIRRDLGEAPSPRAASRPRPAAPVEPAEPEPEPVEPDPADPEKEIREDWDLETDDPAHYRFFRLSDAL